MIEIMTRAAAFFVALLLLAGCGETGRIFGFERGGPDEFTVVRNPPLSVPPQATLRPPKEGAESSDRDDSSNQARVSLLGSGGEKAGTAGTLVTDRGAQPYNGSALLSGQGQGAATDPNGSSQGVATAAAGGGAAPASAPNSAVAGNYSRGMAGSASSNYAVAGVPVLYGSQGGPSRGEAALVERMTAYYGVEPGVRRKVDQESARLALEQEKFLHKVLFWMEPEPPGTTLDANAEARRLQENEALGKPVNAGEAPIIARKKSGISSLF